MSSLASVVQLHGSDFTDAAVSCALALTLQWPLSACWSQGTPPTAGLAT